MKAKTYYIRPTDAGTAIFRRAPFQGWQAPVYVLPASALSKVIEKAAEAAYEGYLDRLFGMSKAHSTAGYPRWVKWRRAPLGHEDTAHLYPDTKLYWRQIARAAYEAGGFES